MFIVFTWLGFYIFPSSSLAARARVDSAGMFVEFHNFPSFFENSATFTCWVVTKFLKISSPLSLGSVCVHSSRSLFSVEMMAVRRKNHFQESNIVEGWEQFSIELLLAVFSFFFSLFFGIFYIHSLSYYCRKDDTNEGIGRRRERWDDEMMENNDKAKRQRRRSSQSISRMRLEQEEKTISKTQKLWPKIIVSFLSQESRLIIIILPFAATHTRQLRAGSRAIWMFSRWFITSSSPPNKKKK